MSRPGAVKQTIFRPMPPALVCQGEVQLGTLYKFRDAEQHGAGILDKEEGRKYLYDNPIIARGEHLSDFAKSVLGGSPHGAVFAQCVFEKPIEESDDCWLYCTSTRLSSRLLPDFESDACVKIGDPAAFYKTIFSALGAEGLVSHEYTVECVYGYRSQHYLDQPNKVPAAALKDPAFSHQHEVRGIFVPRQRPLAVIKRTIPDVRQFCELVETIPDDEASMLARSAGI